MLSFTFLAQGIKKMDFGTKPKKRRLPDKWQPPQKTHKDILFHGFLAPRSSPLAPRSSLPTSTPLSQLLPPDS